MLQFSDNSIQLAKWCPSRVTFEREYVPTTIKMIIHEHLAFIKWYRRSNLLMVSGKLEKEEKEKSILNLRELRVPPIPNSETIETSWRDGQAVRWGSVFSELRDFLQLSAAGSNYIINLEVVPSFVHSPFYLARAPLSASSKLQKEGRLPLNWIWNVSLFYPVVRP